MLQKIRQLLYQPLHDFIKLATFLDLWSNLTFQNLSPLLTSMLPFVSLLSSPSFGNLFELSGAATEITKCSFI